MKTRSPLALAMISLVLVACTGIKAREHVLMPAMSKAWSVVIARHVEVGVAHRLDAGAINVDQAEATRRESVLMQDVLDSGDRTRVITVDWPGLRRAAKDGIARRIDTGEIGPGVGMTFVETIERFDEDMTKLLAR